jgi:hypothetical protein
MASASNHAPTFCHGNQRRQPLFLSKRYQTDSGFDKSGMSHHFSSNSAKMQRQLVFAVEIDTVLLHYKDLTLTLSKSYSSSTVGASKALFSIVLPWIVYFKI